MAHEIRNPLNVIKTGLYLLKMALSKKDEKAKRNMARMNKACDRAASYINDLLNFSRPPALKPMMTQVNDLLAESLEELPTEVLTGVEAKKDLYPEPIWIKADPDRLKQVFSNIIKNASEAMVEAEEKRLEITSRKLKRRDGWVEVCFKDTGSGINEEHLPKLFDPFFSTKGKGTGLGLAISKRIVEAHNGEIKVERNPGRGTTFVVRLRSLCV